MCELSITTTDEYHHYNHAFLPGCTLSCCCPHTLLRRRKIIAKNLMGCPGLMPLICCLVFLGRCFFALNVCDLKLSQSRIKYSYSYCTRTIIISKPSGAPSHPGGTLDPSNSEHQHFSSVAALGRGRGLGAGVRSRVGSRTLPAVETRYDLSLPRGKSQVLSSI